MTTATTATPEATRTAAPVFKSAAPAAGLTMTQKVGRAVSVGIIVTTSMYGAWCIGTIIGTKLRGE